LHDFYLTFWLIKERPEGFVEKIWSFVPTFGTVSTEMKHTLFI